MADTPITRPTDADVDSYLDAVEPERRRADARRLATMLRQVTGEEPVLWGPSIIGYGSQRYTYASGRAGDWPPIGFSPRKTALTIYLTDGVAAHADALQQLGPHTTGKGCLYVKRLDAVDETVLTQILTDTWAARGTNPRG
ncbi:DUF1801 domain-containing protein [Cellulomonas triticagri]|uniref:DUF1801 domain-containing protein n=1 Tax=Cellulomonas triticagri TaxID=2483352 RepID=A0A3M2INT9_9CELL|nr:DUF1801 domain-containing protein [Cellulomonas triticagri]RMI01310.1 DUF1801 domain-containing protein [Cellulomonas triticagri]